MALTQEQRLAALHPTSCLVSAAAGSGKTTTLTERVVRLCLEANVDITDLCIITFTKAAAQEMRRRIGSQIQRLALEGSPRAQRQMGLLGQARIQTIHSFCEWLLRQEWHRAGLDPRSEVLEPAQAEILRHAALTRVLLRAYREEPGIGELLQHYGGLDGDVLLRGAVLQLAGFLDVLPDAQAFLEESTKRLTNPGGDPAHLRLLWQEAVSLGAWAVEELLRSADEGAEQPNAARKEAAWRQAAGVIEGALGPEDFWSLREPLLAGVQQALKMLKGNTAPREALKVLSEIEAWLSIAVPELLIGRQAAIAPRARLLGRLALDLQDAYRQEKRRMRALDFNDLEHEAYRLLVGSADVAGIVRGAFAEVLVDEFQDVNPLQEAIVDLVSRREPRGGSLFAVGDVKQSIYGFRHAAHWLFLERAREYAQEGSTLSMRENFRSRAEIIEVVNHVFTRLFIIPDGPGYGEAERLLARRSPETIPPDGDPSVRLWLIDPSSPADGAPDQEDSQESDAEGGEADLRRAEREALLIALEVERLVQSGHPVHDRETGEIRPVRYGDCAVLLRGVSNVGAQYADMFFAKGVPIEISLTGGYLASLEFRRLFSLLRAVELPERSPELATTLRGPWFRATAQQLLDLHTASREGPLWHGLMLLSERGAPFREFHGRLEAWREMAVRLPVGRLLHELLEETGYRDHVASLPRAAQRLANIDELQRRADAFSERGGGLAGFLTLFEQLGRQQLDAPTPGVGAEDAVQVLSIHRSKGLEFPVVFVGSIGQAMRSGHDTGDPSCHPAYGIGMADVSEEGLRFPSLAQRALRHARRRDDQQEELRLLYVAMTRARDRLYLVGTQRAAQDAIDAPRQRPSEAFVERAGSYLDLLLAATRHEGGMLPIHVQVIESGSVRLTGRRADRVLFAAMAVGEGLPPADPKLTARVEALNDERLPEAPLRAARITATELSRRQRGGFSEVLRQRTAEVPRHPLAEGEAPAEVGTLTHRVLELLDFSPGAPPVRQQMERAVQAGTLPERALSAVDSAALEQFLKTFVAARLRSPGVRLHRELEFTLRLGADGLPALDGDQLVQGKIDLLLQDEQGWLILDFKTDRIAKADALRAAEAYRPQIEIYRAAVREIAGASGVAACLVFLYPGEVVEFSPDDAAQQMEGL